jgi:plastocyanin
MTRMTIRPHWPMFAALALLAAAAACGGGGGSRSSTPTSPSPSSGSPPGGSTGAAAVITITAAGLSVNEVRVEVNARVLFVNEDSRAHEIRSDPHPIHTDCPPINDVGLLAPGARRETGALTRAGTCGFHDHLNPENANLRGRILVGVTEPGPVPDYGAGG